MPCRALRRGSTRDRHRPRPGRSRSGPGCAARPRPPIAAEPALGGLIVSSVLNQPSFEAAVGHRVAVRLGHPARDRRT